MSRDLSKRRTIAQPGEKDDEDDFSDVILGKQRNKIQYTLRKGLNKVDHIHKRKTYYHTAHRQHLTMNDGRLGGAAHRWKEEDEELVDVKAHIKDTQTLLDTTEWDRLVGTGVTTLVIEDDDNMLKIIPKEVSDIQTLRSLTLIWTKVKVIPEHVFDMRLRELCIQKSELKVIDGIHAMHHLEKLELSDGSLKKLPLDLGDLVNLKSLNLTGNKLKMLPPSIGNLNKLEMLKVCGNKLTMLPASITTLKNLHTLDASHNHIKEIPEDIGDLVNVVNFRMSQNNLCILPPRMKEMGSLRNLYLGYNAFSHIPQELGYLMNLQTLNMNGNQIPEVTTPLPQIQTLLLDKNVIDTLRGPMFGCVNLEKLSLQYNKLEYIPSDINKLKKLRALYLGGNDIVALPDELCQLTELRHLIMRETQIQELPEHFDSLRKLSVIDIDETRLNQQYKYALRSDGIDGLRNHVRMRRGSLSLNSTSPDEESTDEEMPETEVTRRVKFVGINSTADRATSDRSPVRKDIISMWPEGEDIPMRPTSNASNSGNEKRKEVKSIYPMEPLSRQETVWSPNTANPRSSGENKHEVKISPRGVSNNTPSPDYSDSGEEDDVDVKEEETPISSSLVQEVLEVTNAGRNDAKDSEPILQKDDDNEKDYDDKKEERPQNALTSTEPTVLPKPDTSSKQESNGSIRGNDESLLRLKDVTASSVEDSFKRVSGPKPVTAPKPRPDSGVPKPPGPKPIIAKKPSRPMSEITE